MGLAQARPNYITVSAAGDLVRAMAEYKTVDDKDYIDGGVDDSPEPLQGGYCDVNFVYSPPDSLQCPVCLSTLKQPHLLSCCGSRMCEVSLRYKLV